MPRNKLTRLLLEDNTADSNGASTGLTKIGIEQISDLSGYLKTQIALYDPRINNYDPLLEIAKIASLTDKEDLQFRCHQEIAKYMYPQIRSLEIQAKEDKEIKISVHLAGYARNAKQANEDVEDIETEDIDESSEHEAGVDYTDYVLKKSNKNDSGDGE